MSGRDIIALLPLVITGYGAVALLVVGAFWRSHRAVSVICMMVLVAAAGSILLIPMEPRAVTPLLRVDLFGYAYMLLFLLGGAAVAILSHDYLGRREGGSEKYYALLLLATLGMLTLVASDHFVSFFLGLEVLSVSLYGLIAYSVRRPASLEAGMKYLVLAGAGLAFVLLGMALVYSEFGTMAFGPLRERLAGAAGDPSQLVSLGIALIIVGFGFKLAAVPFHTWAPDVYQGAPAPVSALVATGSKAAVFALLIRFAQVIGLDQKASLFLLVEVLAIITMFGGNLLALVQRNIKRLLAYSSIAHMGYLFIPLLAGGTEGVSSITFYFVAYFITTIGAFGVVSVLSAGGEEMEDLEDYQGLGLRRPWLGAALALMMLSLAGIPLTVGFMAKLFIFAAAAQAHLWLLLVIGVLNSGVAAYYYLRVLAALYLRPAREGMTWPPARAASAVCLVALTALLIFFGVYPTPLISLTREVAAALPMAWP